MKKLLTLLQLLNTLLISCIEKMEIKEYAWNAAISAPKEYPIEVIRGIIGNEKNFMVFGTIYGINNPGWGMPGGSMGNYSYKLLPNTLEFTWHSLAEDIYYTGKWNLDTDYIKEVFKGKYENIFRSENLKMDNIIIGLGPKGKVVLWVDGAGNRIQVGNYQAHDTIITANDLDARDAHMFKPGRTQDILNDSFYIDDETKQKIKKYGYPNPDLYTQYQKKYNWKVQVNWPKPLYDTRIFYFNGEFETIINEESPFFKGQRAIPERLAISYIDNEKKRGLSIKIHSFLEIIQAFDELHTDNEEIILYIDLDFSQNDAGKVYLKNSKKQIQLKNINIWNSYIPAKVEE